jgi:hypothetical protein
MITKISVAGGHRLPLPMAPFAGRLIGSALLILIGMAPAWADGGITLPTYEPGTTFVYSNGSWETVEAVDGANVTWRSHRQRVSVTSRDFTYRPFKWETRTRQGTRQVRPRRDWFSQASPSSLWPLVIGNQIRYIETGRWQDEEGRSHTYQAQWRAEVVGRERLRVAAGEFDTWIITASRFSAGKTFGQSSRLRDQRTWYYAPAVGHYVRYIKDYRGRKPARSVDLVSVQPPLERLVPSVRSAIDHNFQQALEKWRSGQQLDWKLPQQAAAGMTQPMATFRAAPNQYCRNYVQQVKIGEGHNTYYGMACRNREGNWQIPGK